MTKTARNSAAAAEALFHKHYAAIWGEERWHNSLYPALSERTRQAALVNRYAPRSSFEACVQEVCELQQLEQISFPSSLQDSGRSNGIVCFVRQRGTADASPTLTGNHQDTTLPQPRLTASSGTSHRPMTHWNLDAASALAAHILDVQPGQNILDLCAAPGGKSIALAQSMYPQLYADKPSESPSKSGQLRSNQSDRARFKRLTDNLKTYLPGQLHESKQVASLNIDCTDPFAPRQLTLSSAGYDKVLVDAPCSSERHVIHAHLATKAAGRVAPELASWRPGSSKRLAKTQVELLMTGLRCLRVGGSLLYATCSIEPTENDEVIKKVLASLEKEAKKGGKWSAKVGFNGGEGDAELEAWLERDWAERTKHGWIALPDHPAGGHWGPLFFAVLTKVVANR